MIFRPTHAVSIHLPSYTHPQTPLHCVYMHILPLLPALLLKAPVTLFTFLLSSPTVPSLLCSSSLLLTTPPRPHTCSPLTDAEREEHGDTLHEGQGRNIAREFVDAVRARKGMAVEGKKVVAHAEKQRTLSRKK